MKIKKYILIIIIIIILILSIFFGYFLYKKGGGKIEIITNKEKIFINDVYKFSTSTPLSQKGVEFQNTDDYSISYYPKNQEFLISILNPSLQKTRDEAETYFLEALDINKKEACLLKISLGVPFSINKMASGINYGLSFCPNGISFPK